LVTFQKQTSVDVTVSIFLNFLYFTNYQQRCYILHKNHAFLTVERTFNAVVGST